MKNRLCRFNASKGSKNIFRYFSHSIILVQYFSLQRFQHLSDLDIFEVIISWGSHGQNPRSVAEASDSVHLDSGNSRLHCLDWISLNLPLGTQNRFFLFGVGKVGWRRQVSIFSTDGFCLAMPSVGLGDLPEASIWTWCNCASWQGLLCENSLIGKWCGLHWRIGNSLLVFRSKKFFLEYLRQTTDLDCFSSFRSSFVFRRVMCCGQGHLQ